MTLGCPLLSFVLAVAPLGSAVMPQLRAIDPAAEVPQVQPVQDMRQKTDPPRGTAGPQPRPDDVAPVAPAPAPKMQLTPATFDRSPVYLGCGRRAPACERLTTVGLLSGGAGLALIAGGVGLVLTPDQVIADEPAYIRNYSRIGTTVLALGIGLATTGVLMVFTAAKASRTRRRSAARIAAER